ncbi:MAG: hypothetical protein DWP95_13435 [Proteobacteria bacterium]|nr:MAG: hypothetical protein DWP95_13435 [Pseudomonadota bacterium]
MKKFIIVVLLLISCHASAVYVNHQGMGEVLIVPYYSVNNNLNTLVSVTNTKGTAKAIKITVREGLNGHAVLSYNVYLGAYDTWTFVMGSMNSTATGFEGQASGAMAAFDNSCAPLFNKYFTEFSPSSLVDGPQDLQRTREGFIEIIEMGELQGDTADFVKQINGVPKNCSALDNAWQEGGQWHEASGGNVNQDLAPVSGGLMAEADLIHVASGVNYSIPVVALADFFAEGTIAHAPPDDSTLSLDAAVPKATVLTDEKPYQLSFERGIDAVSAVLMADELIATYALDSGVLGKAETVYTQPTRRFYIDFDSLTAEAPYTADANVDACTRDKYGGSKMVVSIFDRESKIESPGVGVGIPTPPSPEPAYCGSVFVQSMMRHPINPRQPEITGSNNYHIGGNVQEGTENGFVQSKFLNTRPLIGTNIHTNQPVHVMGLPVIGVTLIRFTNTDAQPGILAQYGFSHQLKSKARVIEQ